MWQETLQLWAADINEQARLPGVPHQEDDPIDVPVAQLELEPAEDCLSIPRRRLGFHGKPPIHPADHAVPGPLVARDGEWHFRIPSQRGSQLGREVNQDRELRGIANWRPAREESR